MIRVFVDDDVIRVPQPAVAESNIVRCYAPVPSAEPETARSTAFNPPHIMRSKPTREVPMLPRMIHAIVGIIAPRVMAYPLVARIHVRNIGMSLLVHVIPLLFQRLVHIAVLIVLRSCAWNTVIWLRTMLRWRRCRMRVWRLLMLLCESGKGNNKKSCQG